MMWSSTDQHGPQAGICMESDKMTLENEGWDHRLVDVTPPATPG